jgi:hypothetical protein
VGEGTLARTALGESEDVGRGEGVSVNKSEVTYLGMGVAVWEKVTRSTQL